MARKVSEWQEHADGTVTGKVGRIRITIHPPRPWQFWRGGPPYSAPTLVGPDESRTIQFHGKMSGSAHTLAGAKVAAIWAVDPDGSDVHGHPVPDSYLPDEERRARALFEETARRLDEEFGS